MSPDRDSGRLGDDDQMDEHDDESPRSIFSALWFRALLAVLVLGVLAAVAVPYILDFATTPSLKATPTKSVAMAPAAPVTAAPATPSVTAAPAETPAAPAENAPSTAAPSSSVTAPAKPEAAPAPSAPAKPKASKPAATKSRTAVAKAADAPKPAAKAEAERPTTKADKPAPKADKAAPKEADKYVPLKMAEAAKPSPAKAASGSGGGPYWVQVGAFKDAETSKRLAARLREQGFRVEEATTTSGSPRSSAAPAASPRSADRYDVLVSGASAADVDAKLAPKGLKGETTANGIVVRPSLALREAVTLSRDLADAGLSVQVRRIGGPAPSPTPVTPAPAATTLYRVRVGGFADRAAAVDAMKRLEDKGLKPFLARGNE